MTNEELDAIDRCIQLVNDGASMDFATKDWLFRDQLPAVVAECRRLQRSEGLLRAQLDYVVIRADQADRDRETALDTLAALQAAK